MKKLIFRLVWVMLVVFWAVGPLQSALAGTYSGGGNGTAEKPYRISTAADMNEIGANPDDWDKHFVLTASIDLAGYTGTQFNIIGYHMGMYDDKAFTGVFDGNGHTISNFTYETYETADTDGVGLFGYVDDANAVIRNLTLINPNVNAAGYPRSVASLVSYLGSGTITGCGIKGGSVAGDRGVGGLVGVNKDGTISDCHSSANVSGTDSTGGLVGRNGEGTISNCSTSGTVSGRHLGIGGLVGGNQGTISTCHSSACVSGYSLVGGLVGVNHGGLITSNCYSTGTVLGERFSIGGLVGVNGFAGTIKKCHSASEVSTNGDYVGGLVGRNYSSAIENCYSTGKVSGYDRVGGLVGNNEGGINNCYSAGQVSGNGDYAGGLVGYEEDGTVNDSFWDVNTSGEPNSAGGEGKTTAQMQTMSTFTDAGWDFVGETQNGVNDIWTIFEGDYPKLMPWTDCYSGGDGSAGNPYQIATAENMNEIGAHPNDWDKHFVLTADIDLADYTGTEFNIIGFDWHNSFTGVFDGDGHTISNFTYTASNTNYIGLFGYVGGANAVIKDLTLTDPNIKVQGGWGTGSLVGELEFGTITGCGVEGGGITGDDCTGGLVGGNGGVISNCYASASVSGYGDTGGLVAHNCGNGTISNCYAEGSVTGGDWSTGGLVGENRGTISNCYAEGSVSGGGLYTGGLVGDNFMGTISNCYAAANVSGEYTTGGLTGRNSGTISDCYATAGVSGTDCTGGLVGLNWSTISNCYATGSVTGDEGTGGLVGLNDSGKISASFWDIETTGQSSSDGGEGKTTAEMMTMSTFTGAGWDFVRIWDIVENQTYPFLRGYKDERYVPSQYLTIQAAIDATNDGDTVIVADGTYTGNGNRDIDFGGKAITVKSENGPANCIIDCNGAEAEQHRGFYFHSGEDTNSVLDGFTIINGKAKQGGGIYCDASSRPLIKKCVVKSNSTGVYGGAPTIVDSNIVENNNGIRQCNGQISNCIISENVWSGLRDCSVDIRNCIISKNGGSGLTDCDGDVRNCIITGNRRSGVNRINVSANRLHISSCVIVGNKKDGVETVCLTPTLISNSIIGKNGECGIMACGSPMYITMEYNNVWDNGGGNYCCMTAGPHDISENPLFAFDGYWDAQDSWVNGDYHLLPDSPCVDAGDPNYPDDQNETDIDEQPRIIGGRVDIGADEFHGNNARPIADGGQDQTAYAWIDGIAEVVLDGTGSYDDDGHRLTYLWMWTIDGNNFTSSNPSPTITLPIDEHIIELIVNDRVEDSEPDQVVTTVIEALESHVLIFPPVINRHSGQKNILAWMRLPEGVEKEQISDEPILLYPGEIEAVNQYVIEHGRRGHKRTSVLAFFKKAELMDAVVDNGEVEVEAVGSLTSGRYFYGSDTVLIKARRYRPSRRWRFN